MAWGGAGWVAWVGHSLQCLSRVRGMLMRRCLQTQGRRGSSSVGSLLHSPSHKETHSLNPSSHPQLPYPFLPQVTLIFLVPSSSKLPPFLPLVTLNFPTPPLPTKDPRLHPSSHPPKGNNTSLPPSLPCSGKQT